MIKSLRRPRCLLGRKIEYPTHRLSAAVAVVAVAAAEVADSEITRMPRRISVRTATSNSETRNTRRDPWIKEDTTEIIDLENIKEAEAEVVVEIEDAVAESKADGTREVGVDSSIIERIISMPFTESN